MEEIACLWNEAGVVYGVAHGIEEYPKCLGRDVDVCVHKSHSHLAVSLAAEHLRRAGLKVILPKWDPWPKESIYAFGEKSHLEIDFFSNLVWGPTTVVGSIRPTGRIGPFKVDWSASFAKRVLMHILGGGLPKHPWLRQEEESAAFHACQRLFGRRLTLRLLDTLREKNEVLLRELIPFLQRAAVLRVFMQRPFEALKNSLSWPVREIRPRMRRMVPVLAIVGPDVPDRHSVVQLFQLKDSFFMERVVSEWRKIKDSGKLKSQDTAAVLAGNLLGPLRWSLQAILRAWSCYFGDNYKANSLRPVLYDGWALDEIAVGIAGNGLSPWILEILRVLPKPDLVIFLNVPAEIILAQSPQFPTAEIEKQLEVWNDLVRRGAVDVVVCMGNSPQRAVRRVEELFIEAFIKKHGGHLASKK